MNAATQLSCTRCGARFHAVFTGRICPRCLVNSVPSNHRVRPADRDATATAVPVAGEPNAVVASVAAGGVALRVGARLGDYEFLDVLGRGGMAVVYLARQISLDRLVALKTISARLEAHAPSQERFRREARAVAQLDHPGIVSIYDAGVLAGALFYTMDYVDGADLGRVLRERTLVPRETASLMRQIADAVGYAHARGIVHRDLKPANVLIDAQDKAHVVDFGLAYEAEGAGGGLTLTGDLLGTPPYMAPEILGGGGRPTPAADVYALGAMLFQMLTGRTPFLGRSPSEIMDLAIRVQPPSLRLLNPAVSLDLETICLKCLEKTPSARYRDAAALSEDLARFLDGQTILARPVAAPVRIARWSRRRPVLATLIAALFIGVVSTAWAALVINGARQRAVRAETAAQENLWWANLAQARAVRRNTHAGARREALAAVADAARFRPNLMLRNEAIAALCLDDAVIRRSWPVDVAWTAPVVFDPSLEHYLAETSPGQLTLRACTGEREQGQFGIAGAKVFGIPAFSPDGKSLAVRYTDGAVRVWNVPDAGVIFTLPGRPSPLPPDAAQYTADLGFRADSRQIAIGTPEGGFTLHDTADGRITGRWQADFQPSILRFSPDGSRIAAAGSGAAQVRLIDARTLETLHTVALPDVAICAAWNPAGDQLAVGTRGSRIHFIAAATGQIADTIRAYESGGVGQIVFHPHRPIMAVNGSDESIRFRDTGSGRLLLELEGVNNQPVLAFDAAGSRFCAYDNYTRRATLAEIEPSPIYAGIAPAEPVRSSVSHGALDISPDGRWLLCSSFGAVQLCDARTGRTLLMFSGADDNDMMTAQFTAGGSAILACGTHSGLCRIPLIAGTGGGGQPVFGQKESLDEEPAFTLEGVAADGRALLVSEQAEAAKIVDSGHPRSLPQRWAVPKIASAAFTPDERRVLTEAGEKVADQAAVNVWDTSLPAPRLQGSFGDDPGGRVQCSRAGGWVLVTGDRKSELWRLDSWRRGPDLPVDVQGETHHARLSPDGTTLAVENSGKLHLLATATGERLAVCEAPTSPAGICVNEIFSADNARVVLLWQYGSVHFFDLAAMHRELAARGLDWIVGTKGAGDW